MHQARLCMTVFDGEESLSISTMAPRSESIEMVIHVRVRLMPEHPYVSTLCGRISGRNIGVPFVLNLSPTPTPLTRIFAKDSIADNEPFLDACFMITFDRAKYIFNCAENTTRALIQQRVGFSKVKAIFLTGVNTDRSGGLPGFIMSLADSGTRNLEIYGPLGVAHFLASARAYIIRKILHMKLVECSPSPAATNDAPNPIFSDENIMVFSVPILPHQPIPKTNTPSPLLKRKRSPSPDLPQRQPPPKQPSKAEPRTKAGFKQNIHQGTSQNLPRGDSPVSIGGFNPSTLGGKAAADYRTATVAHMFPGQERLSPTLSDDIKHSSRSLQGPGNSSSRASVQPHPWPTDLNLASNHRRLPSFTPLPLCVSYICVFPEVRGRFDVAKANSLGVRSGPDRGKLTRGLSVIAPDGTTVTPDMCLGPSSPRTALLVIDCPSQDYVPGLTKSPAFEPYKLSVNSIQVQCIFHRVGDGVMQDPNYIHWMNAFGPDVHHIVANERLSTDKATFFSSAFALMQLSHLDPVMFRIPAFSLVPTGTLNEISNLPPSVVVAAHQRVGLRPPTAPVNQSFPDDKFHPYVDGTKSLRPLDPEIERAFSRARESVATITRSRIHSYQPGDNIVVTPLGTGSAMPSKYRNVSSTLIEIPEWGNVLLDCGEGTWGQLSRHFGHNISNPGDVFSVLRDIKCIFISHIHGDHHIGLSKVLAKRRRLRLSTPIYLIATHRTLLYLREYDDLEDIGMKDPARGVRCIPSEHIHYKLENSISGCASTCTEVIGTHQQRYDRHIAQAMAQELATTLGMTSLTTVDVFHRAKCFGLIMKHKDGWSVVFSGDTTPHEPLIDAGQGATLLIHEATMADDQAAMAKEKTHSTFGQAVDVARRMNARNLLVTHFSNRYPKIPQSQSVLAGNLTLAIAFDHASYAVGDMWKLAYYLPALEAKFADVMVDDRVEDSNE